MALSTGSATTNPRTGLAGALYTALDNEFDVPALAEGALKRACNILAGVLVTYLKDNADVVITSAMGGLQRSTVAGAPTDAPAGDVRLSGAID